MLENDIDMKLVAFSKLGVTTGSSNLNSESVPLINSDDMFETMTMELQQLLNKVFCLCFWFTCFLPIVKTHHSPLFNHFFVTLSVGRNQHAV